MSTRQLRLSSLNLTKNRLTEFSGKKINIVMNDRTVLYGEIKSFDNNQLTIENMRRESLNLSLTDISEVYLDFKE